jgi:hypothetical protein
MVYILGTLCRNFLFVLVLTVYLLKHLYSYPVAQITSFPPRLHDLVLPLIIIEFTPRSHYRDTEYCHLSEELNPVQKTQQQVFVSVCLPPPRILVGARFSAPIQTGPGAYPASCTMGTGSFPGVKQLGRGVDHPPPSSAEVKERVELYLYSHSGPSWPVLGWTLPFTWGPRHSTVCRGHICTTLSFLPPASEGKNVRSFTLDP